MSSRFNGGRKRDDIQDFPLLVDEDAAMFHDSSQVCGMERGGDYSESESCSLMDILSVSYRGPSDDANTNGNNNQLSAFHEQQGGLFSPVAHRHTRRRSNSEELEELYSFSTNEDDDMLMEDDRMSIDDDGQFFFNANEFSYGGTSNEGSMESIPMPSIRIEEPLMPLSEDRAFNYENDAPRNKTIRFADEVDSQLVVEEKHAIGENSMTMDDLQDKHLDIFDQGFTTRSSSLFSDEDASHAEDDFDDEEDDEEDEDDLERRILTSLMYNGATMGVVAGLGFVAKKVMSAFQKSEDDGEGGNGLDQMMGDGTTEATREAATDAASGSINNSTLESSQGNASQSSQQQQQQQQ